MSKSPKHNDTSADAAAEAEVDAAIHQQEAHMMDEEVSSHVEGDSTAEGSATVSSEELAKEQEQKFLRMSADFANYKRRTEKEKADIYKSANERLIQALLPVIDNVERALSHSEESSKELFVSGIEMVFKNMMEIMAKEGLKAIEAIDQPFDHNLHHAVMTEPKEGYDSDYVIGVLQKGYQLGDKVIRPAMVKVSE